MKINSSIKLLKPVELVFCFGAIISIFTAVLEERHNQRIVAREVEGHMQQLTKKITDKIDRYEDELRDIRGVILTVGVESFTHDSFQRYALSNDLSQQLPGAHGFGFIRRVAAKDVQSFVDHERRLGVEQFSTHQFSAHEGDLYVIQYIEPLQQNLAAVGLDIASESLRKAAADRAMREGTAHLTAPLTLVQMPGSHNRSFLFLLPVYRTAVTPPTASERIESLIGWTYIPLNINEVLESVFGNLSDVHAQLTDITDEQAPHQFYKTEDEHNDLLIPMPQKQVFEVCGRRWQLEIAIHSASIESLNLISPIVVLTIGILFTTLVSTLVASVLKGLQQKNAIVVKQAQLAAIVESSRDGIISITMDGVVTSWNRGAELIFGFSLEESLDRKIIDLIVPEAYVGQEKTILTTIARGESVGHFRSMRRKKDGSLIDVSITVSPIFDKAGRVIGASKTVRDITEQKRAEEKILSLNFSLESQVIERTESLEKISTTLRTVLDSVPSLVAYCDRDLISRVANKAFLDWWGIDPAQVVGMHVRDILGDANFEKSLPRIQAALRGEPQLFQRTMPHRDMNGLCHSQINYLPEFVNGEVAGIYVFMTDITEIVESKNRLKAALQENAELLTAINETVLVSVTDADGNIISVNDKFCDVTGFDRYELIGKNHRIVNSGAHSHEFWRDLWTTLSAGKTWRGEICNCAKDGRLHWFDTVMSPFKNIDGIVDRFVSFRTDITTKKNAELEFKRLNVLFKNVLHSASEISIIATDLSGIITLFNRGSERMLGYAAEEVIGKLTPAPLHDINEIVSRSRELQFEYGIAIEGFRVFVHKAELEGVETRNWTYIHKDGRRLTVSLAVTAIRDTDGTLVGYLGVASDVTQQIIYQRELVSARDQLTKAAEVAELGVWTWALDNNTLWWNERMFAMYDQPLSLQNEGLNYSHWAARVHPEDFPMAEASLMAAVEGRDIYDIIFRLIDSQNNIHFIQAGAQVERDNLGRAIRVTGINRDITAQRELETHLRYAKEQADAANAAKSSFLANMSHEIRTPMNAVMGMLQLVQQTQLTLRQKDYVVKAHSAAKSLLGLLNDILDFSKIDAGKLELDFHSFELEGLLQDLAVILTGNQGNKDVEVMFDIAADLPHVIVGDRLRLQQILINLAGNALKFTAFGQVVVSVKLLKQVDANVSLRIAVTDTGIGVSSDQLNRIFDGFVQAEASTTRRYGGTGLGLVISKRLIELMGGALSVDSELGKGSCFSFDITVPFFNPDEPETKLLSDLSVLVVDDNDTVADILMRTVSSLGWRAERSSGGLDAVERVAAAAENGRPYELVLMDWGMPDLDGLAAAERIKQLPSHGSIHLIMMVTSHGRDVISEAASLSNAPFVDYLTKPVTPQQLADAVHKVFSGTTRAKTQLLTTKTLQALAGLRLLVVEDNELNRQVAFELLSNEGATVVLAEGGLEGVDKVLNDAQPYDLIVMDIQMPDIDGLEATRRIRADGRFNQLPILAMTANASQVDREACLASGMNDHMGKPIDMLEVTPKILSLIGRQFKPLAAAQPSTEFPAPVDSVIEELSIVLKRFASNLPMYRSLLERFHPEATKLLTALAINVSENNRANAIISLHSLKGVASTMGAKHLAARASTLEKTLKADESIELKTFLNEHVLQELLDLLNTSCKHLLAAAGVKKEY